MKRYLAFPIACSLAGLLCCLNTPVRAQQLFPATGPQTQFAARGRELPSSTAGENIPAQVQALPEVQAKMRVIHRRSQLVVGRTNIIRTAVADSGVADVVHYSPSEIAIIGMALGTTTVTIWFDNSPDPVIYLIEVIRDPDLEERARLDYGRLQQKISLLFPNSKVYLIPMSTKIVVKGQAKDSEEATRIMQIVRGEVINQYGALLGPGSYGGGYGGLGVFNNLFGAGYGGYGGLGGAGYGALGGFGYGGDLGFAGGGINDLASSFIVNMLEVPGEFQIALRVRIAELNRSQLRRNGVNFNFLVNDRTFFNSLLAGAQGTLQGTFDSGRVNVLLDALHANGTAKILAEPQLTVLSGHPANFISGGEFAVPTVVGIGGAQGQQTSFRGFGTSVRVIPTVIDKDLIRMQISPEFSEVNNSNRVNGIPGTNTRRVDTTVELREGQTIALAGLLSHRSQTEVAGVPYLGEIPVVGPLLFKAKQASMEETELLILVTPEIVRPMDPEEVPPVPGYEVTHPNDCELYWYGMTEGAPHQAYHQLAPYGHGSGRGVEVGYSMFAPGPASPGYHPAPTNPFGGATSGYGTVGPSSPFGNSRYAPVGPGATPTQMGPAPNSAPIMTPTPAGPGTYPTPVGPGSYSPAPTGYPSGSARPAGPSSSLAPRSTAGAGYSGAPTARYAKRPGNYVPTSYRRPAPTNTGTQPGARYPGQ